MGVLARINRSTYPNASDGAVGLYPNIGYGTLRGAQAHAIVGGATDVLAGSITSTDTTFDVVDTDGFPAAPFTVQVGSERMRVTNVSGDTFTVTRGYDSTTARAHRSGRTIYEVLSEYVYIVAGHSVKAIDRVLVEDTAVSTGVTAYTGQAGDEHADWPGVAVVAFTADAVAERQFALEGSDALAGASGPSYDAEAAAWSDSALVDGVSGTHAHAGGGYAPTQWVEFADNNGAVVTQQYSASVTNPGASAVDVVFAAVSTAGARLASITRRIEAGATEALTLGRAGGDWADKAVVAPQGLGVQVEYISKSVTVATRTEDMTPVSIQPDITAENWRRYGELTYKGRRLCWADYDTTDNGTIERQTHTVNITETGGAEAKVRLTANGNIIERIVPVSSAVSLDLEYFGGAWGDRTTVVCLLGDVLVNSVGKTVEYYTDEMIEREEPAYGSTADLVVGAAVTMDADWAVDASGDYGGSGSLIERPDWVIKHWLIEWMGFSAGDINSAAFTTAGSGYAGAVTGGYLFGFVLTDGGGTPSVTVRALAAQARSVLRYVAGEWYLDCLPDSAPAADATIETGELAGEYADMVFNKSPIEELDNSLTARYRFSSDGESRAMVAASDPSSISAYGTYEGEVDLWAIRAETTAQDVLDHMLLQRAVPLLVVEFRVFWDRFDLAVGDTVDISHELWSGEKFYIERIERESQAVARITARQWWS